MARFKKMTAQQEAERNEDLETLRNMLNDEKHEGICMKLSQITGKSYSTILQIKNGKPNPRHSTIKKLLAAVEDI